jgi:hypothetical protein
MCLRLERHVQVQTMRNARERTARTGLTTR